MRLLARELQSALPNSIACSGSTLQFLTIRSGGRFREEQTGTPTGTPLTFGAPTTGFDTIGGNADTVTKDARGNSVSSGSNRVVVGNLTSGAPTCHSDYSNIATANNAATVSSIGTSSVAIVSNNFPTDCKLATPTVVDDGGTPTVNEANNREFGKFYVVDSTPVTFAYDVINGLTRNTIPVVAASHVSGFQVACDDTKARVQMVTFNLKLNDKDSEIVNMLRRVTIVNRP